MVRVVVDSSILIEKIRWGSKYYDQLLELEKLGEIIIYIPVVVITELWAGKSMFRKKDSQIVEHLISTMRRIDIDERIARLSGELVRSVNIQPIDALIAASAVINDSQLATLNTKHFKNINGLKLYKYEKN